MTHSESQAVQDQTDPDLQVVYENCDHRMISIKTSSPMVPWIERCQDCGLIDSHALEQTGHQIIKVSLSERAGRIAVTAESEPFAFTQNSFDDLDLQEVLGQALGAASVCWVGGTGSLEFDGTRAKAIYEALMREVARFQRLALEDAATRAVEALPSLASDDAAKAAIRKAVECVPESV